MPAMFPESLSGRAVLPTACLCEGVVARLAAVTLVPHHSWLTGAPAIAVTLSAQGTWNGDIHPHMGKKNGWGE